MDKTRKMKLINYLYQNNKVAEFMYKDLYVELNTVLPKKLCFSIDNYKTENRINNLNSAINILKDFLSKNSIYYDKLNEIYNFNNVNDIIKDILAGYILFLTAHINKNTGADVYADKRSICYSKASILDLDI